MPTGEIEPRQVQRLQEMGAWLKKNGASIYATRGGPFKPGAWGGSTHRGRSIYLHIFDWPGDKLILPPIDKKIVRASLLTGGKVQVRQTAEGITLTVPPQYRRTIDTLVELQLNEPASQIAPVAIGK